MSSLTEFIVDNSHTISCVIDFNTLELHWTNPMTRRLFPLACTGNVCFQAFFSRDSRCDDCPLEMVRQSRSACHRSVFFDATRQWFDLNYRYAVIDGKACCVCTGTDVSALKTSLKMAQDVLDSLHACAYIVDRKTYRLRFANRALRDLLPVSYAGTTCYRALRGKDEPCEDCYLQELDTMKSRHIETYNTRLNRLFSIDGTLLKTPQDEDLAVFTAYDITYRLEYESQLARLAYSDRQLGTGNPAAFDKELSEQIANARSRHLCVVSVRNFNNVNMLFGRSRGDRILQEFARALTAVAPDGKIYRTGGCKFALVFDEVQSGCRQLASAVENVFSRLSPEEKNFRIPTDCVFVAFPRFGKRPEDLLLHAEYKLKNQREADREKPMIFNERDYLMIHRRSLLTSVIRKSIDNNHFQVVYQPIYSVGKNGYFQVEALLRLHDAELGAVGPEEFIPIAEEQGLIHDLGLYVLKQVCRMLAERQEKRLSSLDVHVNVSTLQFSRDGFFDRFMEVIDRYSVDPCRIVIEVTESLMIQSFDYIMTVMNRFIARGVRFSLDDFGTGYSSLNYIAALPISSIKLDKSFIDRMQDSEMYRLLIKNVIGIARRLRFELIAEGVENEIQMKGLKQLGCDAMQGYYFSRPLPTRELDAFLLASEQSTKGVIPA